MAGGSFKSFLKRKKKANNSSGVTTEDDSPPNPQCVSISRTCSQHLRLQIDELEQVFKKFDANGDGKISSSELGNIMSSLGQEVTNEELETMIKEVDADGDGSIDLDEFIELNTKGVDSDEIMQSLKEAFSVYDIDGNGNITAEELHKVMQSLGDNCSIAECRRMISGVDSDGDGTINFEEFKVMMMVGSRLNGVSNKE